MGACQNYGPFLGTPNIRCRIIIGTQKGTIILTSTHMYKPRNCGRDALGSFGAHRMQIGALNFGVIQV